MTKAIGERELVLGILMEVTQQNVYSHIALANVLEKYQYLDKKERAFITRVTEGTLEHMIELDYILNQFSKVKVNKMKPVIRNILRSAVYQLKYMDSVPDSAACNEAVKLAVKKGFGSLRGFVNGVLRNAARNLDTVQYPKEGTERLSVQYSMPEWILKLWQESYDEKTIEMMLQDFQKEKPLTIRCNLNRLQPEKLAEELRAEGVQVEVHPYLPYALQIRGYDHLARLNAFQEGDFYVQDISSMLVGEIADPKEGSYVIDVCAAPGGKALHIAEKQNGTGCVEARDLSAYKTGLIRENIMRSRLENIHAVQMDATVFDEASVQKADLVIADLPCSGLGVLGRKTDLKYKASLQGTEELAALQREILKNAQAYVRPGGTLIYSTCTINPGENGENVRWFLEQYPEFEQDTAGKYVCRELAESVGADGCLQLLPGIHKSDGFFIARFVKKRK